MGSETLVMMQTMFTPRTGDEHASSVQRLDLFLRSAERQAYTMAKYATGNHDEALDIVQDAMTAFVRRYQRKPEQQWRPLFFRSVDNRIKDWFRRRKVRLRWMLAGSRQQDDLGPESQAENLNEPQPDRALANDQTRQTMDQALCALPHRQRQAFLLRTWQGMSVAETAKVMGCSEGSVKTHLSRATQALREKLNNHHGVST
ncbi:MAG: RNA polymerase sigma factor [Lysobacterales bacterium]